MFHQIFDWTFVGIDPAEPRVRTLTRRRLVPPKLTDGPYRVGAAVAGLEGECLFAPDVVQVMAPRAPELTIEYARLNNNSFRLPSGGEPVEERLGHPAYSLSLEIGNVGLPVSVPVEVALTLTVNGATYPLLVWGGDEDAPVLRELYVFEPEDVEGVSVTVSQDSIRGAVVHPHQSPAGGAALRELTEDTLCWLNIVVDPNGKVPEMDRDNNEVSLPVMLLHTEPPLEQAACGGRGPAADKAIFNDCSGTPDPDNPNLIFCFGPSGPPASDSWSGSWMYAGYQFGGSASDPSYLGYGDGEIPESAHFHTASWVKAGLADCDKSGNCWEPLNLLLDFVYAFPPEQSGDELVFADFTGNLTILGDTLFNFNEALQIKSKDNFTWYKKDKSWTLFEATVDCGFVPLHFSAGAQGAVGIGGNVTLTSSEDTSFTAALTLGPYASLGGYGQAGVDFVVCSAGVGVDLGLIDLEPSIEPHIEYFAPTNGHQAAIDIGARGPLTIQSGNGDFYAYVKVFFHKFQTPIVSWQGYDHTVNLFTPFSEFIGPIGEFLMTTDGDDANPTMPWAVYADQPGHSYTWNGRLSLEAATYEFVLENMCQASITPDDGHSGDSHSWTCSSVKCVETVTLSQGGNYTLNASTDPTCFPPGPAGDLAFVIWAETGASAVGGLSGWTGNPDGTASRSVDTWYYNSPYGQDLPPISPAYYTNGSEVDFRIAADNTPQKDVVNTPEQGLWIQVAGQVPIPLDRTRDLVFMLQVNPPRSGVPKDSLGFFLRDQAGGLLDATISPDDIRPDGTIIYPYRVPATNGSLQAPGDTPVTSVSFEVCYSSPDKAHTHNPPGARLRMVVVPRDEWLVQTTCLDAGGSPHIVSNLYDGPSVPGRGTMRVGALNLGDVCQSAGYASWQSDYVVGAFDFSADGSYDFFPGALSMAQYTLWVDGVRKASRAVSDAAATPPRYPDQDVCVNSDGSFNPQCPVRQNHEVVDIPAGTHIIEAYYEQAARNGPETTAKANQLRWDPVADQQYLVSFYRKAGELECALSPGSAACHDLPEAAGVSSYSPEPLLILKVNDPNQAGYALDWQQMPDDCNRAAGNQLDCADSLAQIYGCTPDGWPGWFVLYSGGYQLQDQQLYHFEGGTTTADPDTTVDFRLDGQPHATYNIGPVNPPANTFNPYSPSQFVGVLMNQDPGTASGENEIVLGAYSPSSDACTAPQPPPDLSLTWAAFGSSTAYAIYFIDENGTPTYAGQGGFGTGTSQTVCAGAGTDCPHPVASIPPDPRYLIVGSLQADPTYTQQADVSPPLVDLLARFPNHGTCAQDEPAWVVDMCVNGWCAAQVSMGEPGPEEIARDELPSPLYMPYSMQSQSSMAQGLIPQTANSLLIAAEPRECLGLGPLRVELSYAEHTFNLTLPVTRFTASAVCPAPECTIPGIEVQAPQGPVSVSSGTLSNWSCTGQDSCTFDLTAPLGESRILVSDTVSAVPIFVTCERESQMNYGESTPPRIEQSTPSPLCQCTFPIEVVNTCGPVTLEFMNVPGTTPASGHITNSTCTGPMASCSLDVVVDLPPYDHFGGVPFRLGDGIKTDLPYITAICNPQQYLSVSPAEFRDCQATGVQAYNTCGTLSVLLEGSHPPGINATISNSTCVGPQASCHFDISFSGNTWLGELFLTDGTMNSGVGTTMAQCP